VRAALVLPALLLGACMSTPPASRPIDSRSDEAAQEVSEEASAEVVEEVPEDSEPKHGHPESSWGPGRLFPLFGRRVSSMGHELPRPVGLSYVGFYMKRSFLVTELQLAQDGGDPVVVEKVTVLPDSESSANTVRVDLWVLPFLNIYGFYGRTSSDTVTFVTIENPLPGPGQEPITFQVPTNLDGNTWGLGGVLAGGYKGFFGTVNLNYSVTDLGIDSEITANVNSVRVGYQRDFRRFSAALWLGYVYWHVAKKVEGSVVVPDAGTLDFAVNYEPIEPSNMILGGRLALFDRVDLVLEYGFWKDVTTLTGQVSIRF